MVSLPILLFNNYDHELTGVSVICSCTDGVEKKSNNNLQHILVASCSEQTVNQIYVTVIVTMKVCKDPHKETLSLTCTVHFNSFYFSEDLVKQIADHMVSDGYRDVGYEYVSIDVSLNTLNYYKMSCCFIINMSIINICCLTI